MANEQFYMGKDGFAWFVGVVEDRDDPDQQGRVRVRCLGHHTENITELPTTDLPWAHVLHPVTDPSMHGMGNSSSWLVEGSWVMGFFRDAIEKQYPIAAIVIFSWTGSIPARKILLEAPRSRIDRIMLTNCLLDKRTCSESSR